MFSFSNQNREDNRKWPRLLPVGRASIFKMKLYWASTRFVQRTILNKEPDRLNEQGKDVRLELRVGAPADSLRVPCKA